jgi:hypothetical protein
VSGGVDINRGGFDDIVMLLLLIWVTVLLSLNRILQWIRVYFISEME